MMSVGGVLISLSLALSLSVEKPLVCDAWPVWWQTYSYLPSHQASSPFDNDDGNIDLRAQQDYEPFRQGLKTWLFSRY